MQLYVEQFDQQSAQPPQDAGSWIDDAWRAAGDALQEDWARFHAQQARAQETQSIHVPRRYETLLAKCQRPQMERQRRNNMEAQAEQHRVAEEERQKRYDMEAQAHYLQQLERHKRADEQRQQRNNEKAQGPGSSFAAIGSTQEGLRGASTKT